MSASMPPPPESGDPTPADVKISEALRKRFDEAAFFPVIVELAVGPDGAGDYAALDATYQKVASAILAAAAQDGTETPILDPASPAIAPYLFATLRGSRIVALLNQFGQEIVRVSLNEHFKVPNAKPIGFQANLVGEAIAEPLASRVRTNPARLERVIIALSNQRTSKAGREAVLALLQTIRDRDRKQAQYEVLPEATHPYVFATMTGYAILALIDLDRRPVPPNRAIFRIWEDAQVRAFITDSVATIKADAAHIAFSASGKNIAWAVLDSGIDADHPHFRRFKNVDLGAPLAHKDFRGKGDGDASAVVDQNGHGTHVAGIIAGMMPADGDVKPVAVVSTRNEAGAEEKHTLPLGDIGGMAPQCKIVSLRVLDDDGTGVVSSLISAIDQIQQWNEFGRHLVVHGVNLSLGYPFDAEWFACGQSPICVEIDRLVDSGVAVVVAAGNSGYGYLQSEYVGAVSQGFGMSINDPGNSELAITVGSTHRTEPHRYGVSYFSSKGPTGDGRPKPDLIAPGERIISCASAQSRSDQVVVQKDGDAPSAVGRDAYLYKEDSGTSMAAPHVSGIIAAFLSIRREYIGRPRDVKAIFMQSATDLHRDRSFQGAGLVDLMRAIQSV
ncbi:MAG: peptidase in kexin sedolisin [Candidatus Eremiobacteraeota bacterium]|nr:peptidase in kexin sedolisin [Candidatus Eremiobacteraeota bacterium]